MFLQHLEQRAGGSACSWQQPARRKGIPARTRGTSLLHSPTVVVPTCGHRGRCGAAGGRGSRPAAVRGACPGTDRRAGCHGRAPCRACRWTGTSCGSWPCSGRRTGSCRERAPVARRRRRLRGRGRWKVKLGVPVMCMCPSQREGGKAWSPAGDCAPRGGRTWLRALRGGREARLLVVEKVLHASLRDGLRAAVGPGGTGGVRGVGAQLDDGRSIQLRQGAVGGAGRMAWVAG